MDAESVFFVIRKKFRYVATITKKAGFGTPPKRKHLFFREVGSASPEGILQIMGG